MGHVGEDDALIDGAEHMRLGVEVGEADEGASGLGALVGAVEEGQEDDLEGGRVGLLHPAVGEVVDAAALGLACIALVGEEIVDEPLHVARGGGAALFDEEIAGDAVHGVEGHGAVGDGGAGDELVDAPGAGDHAQRLGVVNAHRQAAGVHVEHAGGAGGAHGQAGLGGRRLGDAAADLGGVAKGRELVVDLLEAVERHELLVVLERGHIHQVAAGEAPRLLNWGMVLNGVCITAQISEFPSKDGDCILSQVLEDEVPEKYFLSPAAMRKILSSSSPDRRDSASMIHPE